MSKNLRAREDANESISKLWNDFRHYKLRRCTSFAEMIAEIRKFKTELRLEAAKTKNQDWLENTSAFLDLKIEEIIALQDAKAAPKKKGKKKSNVIWLPQFMRKKQIKPPEAN